MLGFDLGARDTEVNTLTFLWVGTDNEQISYLDIEKSAVVKEEHNNGVGRD